MNPQEIQPVCPVYGQCGGCQYQHLPYGQELKIKQDHLHQLFCAQLQLSGNILDDIVASPQEYHYRSRLDMRFFKTKKGEFFMGFSPADNSRVIEVKACPIAMPAVSDFLPELKLRATEQLPAHYCNANLVVKTGDDGRVLWGGIGRRSLRLQEEDYLWTQVKAKKIFYSLETFFQANLSILARLFDRLESLFPFDGQTIFYDLYAGVGLFAVVLAEKVKKVVLIEENKHSVSLAKYNVQYHNLKNCEIIQGDVAKQFPALRSFICGGKNVALIDPPRDGLTAGAAEALCALKNLDCLFYLSCQPESLVRDVGIFLTKGWQVKRIVPFDFFPRTKHIETLVVLCPHP